MSTTMTQMQKVVLLLTFWFSPPSAHKEDEWKAFVKDEPLDEDTIIHIIGNISYRSDDFVDWSALEQFKADVSATLN